MISLEEIKILLPQYLSPGAKQTLFDELKRFSSTVDNIDSRIYSIQLLGTDKIYQGDGICGMMVCNLPSTEARGVPSIIFSNSCDINIENRRFFPSRIVYSPIINLAKYQDNLISEFVDTRKYPLESILNHIDDIKKQKITQILFLPKGGKLAEDSIVFFDRVNNFPLSQLSTDEMINNRIFVLLESALREDVFGVRKRSPASE